MRSLSEEKIEVKTGTYLKIALVVVSTAFVISLFANLYLYTRQYGITPDSGLENQVSSLQDEIESLENQVSSLQDEIESLKFASLVKVNLLGTDNRPWFQTPYLHVEGCIVNAGTYTAYNCKLHVILYQGEVVAEDTYINLGTISGENWKVVDSEVYYEGEELTHYSITPEWD